MNVINLKPFCVLSVLTLIMLSPGFMNHLEALPENEITLSKLMPSQQTAKVNNQQTFTSYKVKLKRIKLFKRQGHETLLLPVGLHINFVQYHNADALLDTLSVPIGVYERVVLSLDFTQAQAEVKGPYGYPQAVMLMDDDHRPLQTLEVSINLLKEHRFNALWGQVLLL